MTTTDPRRLRLPAAPEEGWLTLVFLAVMAFALAAAIDDTGWVLGSDDLTNFLVLATMLGVAAGFIGSKVGWNRWLANLVGAIFAALIVPILVGQVLQPTWGIGAQYAATADAAVGAWNDLVINRQPVTNQTGHYLLVLGLLCWGTGQFAASAVFRHHRPLSAVVVIGAVLVANMAATSHDQIWYLVLFSLAALLLLTRLHALDEQATWARRRIGDPSAVGTIYLRGGAVFIAIAVLGSLTLTATATSKPLEGAWDSVKPWLLDVGTALQRFLPTLEDGRGIGGVQFGPRATINGVWTTDGGTAMTVSRTPGDNFPYYYRAVAYDRYNDFGWEWSGDEEMVRTPRPAGSEILEGSFDRVLPPGTKDVPFRVVPNEYHGYVVSPLAPLSIDRDVELQGAGEEAFFQALEIDGNDPYAVTARVSLRGDADGGLTENKLRAAGDAYPPQIRSRYTQLTPTAVGPEAEKILADVKLKVEADGRTLNPFDLSVALVTELQSQRFEYDSNVLDIDCGELSFSECFATYKQGYCQHYATLMTVLLRQERIPARYVQGFLPGELDRRTGIEVVPNSAAHAWVEVFFPGYGWVPFDPTGGGVSEARPLPSGAPQASASASRFPSLGVDPRIDQEGPSRLPGAVPPGPQGPGGVGPAGFILITVVLLATLAIAAFLVWRRGPRGPLTPEGAWVGVGRLAARFGFGPRPTQTAYEYATALGEVLPGIRPELQTVATAKVETAYGGRVLGDDRIRALRDSYVKLRVGLLRLLFRRRDRRKR